MEMKEYNFWKKKIAEETLSSMEGRFTHDKFVVRFHEIERKYGVSVETDQNYESDRITGGHRFIDYNERPFRWLGQKVKKGVLVREKVRAIWYYEKV